jgi:hypothetical protein
MAKTKYFMPKADEARAFWFDNFYQTFLLIFLTFGFTAPQMALMLLDLNAYKYTIVFNNAVKAFTKTCSAFKKAMNNGTGTAAAAFPVFAVPPLPPPAVPPGVFTRLLAIIKIIKANPNYTVAIGMSLKIIGAEINPDWEFLTPDLSLTLAAGKPKTKCPKQNTDGIQLLCMRGTETVFTLIATVTLASYTDIRANLVAGQPETRIYKALFLVNDVVVGIPGNPVSIMVAA